MPDSGSWQGGLAGDADLAARLVREAGALAARMRRAGIGGAGGLRISAKTNITDVVSDADRAAEKLIVDSLTAARPRDGLIGEEGASIAASTTPVGSSGDAREEHVAQGPRGERIWYADPVDGTFNFVSGLDLWCSAVALTVGGEPALGAIYQPSRDELWLGGPDLPTTLNGRPVARMVDRPLRESSLATYLHPTTMHDPSCSAPTLAAMAASSTVRMLGSGSIELAGVAAGRIGVWIQHSSAPWDWFPGAAIVQGAGGVATVVEIGDRRWHLAGPPTAVAQLAELVRASLRPIGSAGVDAQGTIG